MTSATHCPLCNNPSGLFDANQFFKCDFCGGIFRSKDFYLSPRREKERYLEHNNNVYDTGYRKFVSPITQAVLADFNKDHQGLDFGAGAGPVISTVLREKGYDIIKYDPFFHPDSRTLNERYDYIVCCEVIEHFHKPMKEFLLLKKLLKPAGRLYCMTHLISRDVKFSDWYYKKDPAHVFFYSKKTLEWIARQCRYSNISICDRLIIFEND